MREPVQILFPTGWGGKNDVYIYPLGELSYDVIGHYFILTLILVVTWRLTSLRKIFRENSYVSPGLNVMNTNHKFRL